MTYEEAAIERSRIVEADRERVAKERSATIEERVQQQSLKNSERRTEREAAIQSITSGSVNLQEIARQGGALGRRIEREIRRFEQTGQVSGWLAGETIKAEAAQNAAQQSAFRQAVVDVVSTSQNPLELNVGIPFASLHKEPKIELASRVASKSGPWDLIATPVRDNSGNVTGYKIRVQAGTLSGILPSNWDIEVSVGLTGLYYAKAIINTNQSSITSVSIAINTSPPDIQKPQKFAINSRVEYLFGMFYEERAVRTIASGHITLLPRIWLTAPADPPREIGQSPYDQYYLLQ
jgi:hypothetical protein